MFVLCQPKVQIKKTFVIKRVNNELNSHCVSHDRTEMMCSVVPKVALEKNVIADLCS